MTAMWRPPGWTNPYHSSHMKDVDILLSRTYEAGADAILKELKNSCLSFAHYSIALQSYIKKNKKGRLVFIIDDAATDIPV